MADEKKEAPVPADKPKTKRKVLTTAERIAKAEADLAALRDKAGAKDRKRLADLTDKVTKLTARRDEINTQLKALAAEQQSIETRLAPATTEKPKG